jgi:hypothetical protein
MSLIVAPLLGLTGVYVGYVLNSRREDRALRRELALERHRDGRTLFDEVVHNAGRRFVAQQRWLDSIAYPDAYAGLPVRSDYFELVREWNAANWSRRARLKLMLGDEVALRFLDYADDTRRHPKSLHYRFVSAHRAVMRSEAGGASIEQAQEELDQLNHAWSDFADDIAQELSVVGSEMLGTPSSDRRRARPGPAPG